MSILISAPIRTGKTLRVIKHIFEELEKGRQVFTNIVGIKIDGVISVSSSIAEPFDWRNLPNGSVLVWDEAHEHPAFAEKDLLKNYELQNKWQFDEIIEKVRLDQTINTTEKKSKIEIVQQAYKKALERKKEEIRDIGAALLMHGHYGVEIYFITQRVTKLNTDVLASVTSHFVMRRKFGADAAIIWEFGEAMTTWSKSTSEIALNKTLWRYPKYLYKFYISSENHQVRKSFPAKYYAFGLLPVLMFGYGFLKAQETGFFGLFGDKKVVAQNNQAQAEQVVHPPVAEQPTLNPDDKINCTAENVHLLECQKYAVYFGKQTVQYSVNDPYNSQAPSFATIDVSDGNFPRISGCIKFDRRYYAIDQQGNKMPNVSGEACKRWLENGERPYNYYVKQTYSDQPKSEEENKVSTDIAINQQDNKSSHLQQSLGNPI
jgi:zona occludens toxin